MISCHTNERASLMLSVADVLEHKTLQGARVVGGQVGLSRSVLWLHNVGVPDAPHWLNGGELVLTTMLNLPEGTAEQQQYIADLAQKGVAGLILTTGRYIQEVPDHLITAANQHQLPLIEISFEVRFVDVAKAINEWIAQDNLERVRRALDIHQTLTNLVLQGGGLQDLADRLADLIGHSISIETDHFEAIATRNIAAVDEARRYTQLHGHTDPRLVAALEDRGYLPQIHATLHPLHLAAMPDVGLEMERILAPIVVHGAIYGYMWIIADDHALSEIDMMAIESGSTIAALMLLYQESLHSAEASLKGTMLSQLIQGEQQRETILVDQSLRYGVDLRDDYVMLVVARDTLMPGQHTHYRAINRLLTLEGWSAVASQFAGQIVILTNGDAAQLARLIERIQERMADCRIAISSVQRGAHHVKVAYEQCQDALHIAQRLTPHERVTHFTQLGYIHALYQAGAQALVANPHVPVLRCLLDETQADLLPTLEAYLDAGGNGVQTAAALHIHRSTLNYRLQRITALTRVDLQDPTTRMNLQVALKLMWLFDTSIT